MVVQSGRESMLSHLVLVFQNNIAIEKYNKAEMDATIYLTVLLSVTDAKTLKQAYPNYFGSTTAFTKFLHKHDQEHHDALLFI